MLRSPRFGRRGGATLALILALAVSGGGSAPLWASPNELLFSASTGGTSGVYALDPASGAERRITLAAEDAERGVWSPERNAIAYVRYTERQDYPGETRSAIVLSDDLGLMQRDLTDGSAYDTEPSWSPDGTAIAFVRFNAIGWSHIGVVDVASGTVQFVTPEGKTVNDVEPRWSPAGGRLFFTRWMNGKASIYSVNPDGSELDRVVSRKRADATDPDVAPNGERIVYVEQRFGSDSDICIVDATGGSRQCVAATKRLETQPEWSPDSTRIAFVRTPGDGDGDIWLLRLRGERTRRLTRGAAADAEPTWSPGGDEVAFIRIARRSTEIHLTEVNGDSRRLTSTEVHKYGLDW